MAPCNTFGCIGSLFIKISCKVTSLNLHWVHLLVHIFVISYPGGLTDVVYSRHELHSFQYIRWLFMIKVPVFLFKHVLHFLYSSISWFEMVWNTIYSLSILSFLVLCGNGRGPFCSNSSSGYSSHISK